MRNFYSLAAFAAVFVLAPAEALAQFTIDNYALVSEIRLTRTISDFEYRANVINTGPARSFLTATVSSAQFSTQVVRNVLHFSNVPANGTATSIDTFILRIDRASTFVLANVQWRFSPAQAPIANPGPPQTAGLTQVVTLNGTGSSNPSGVNSPLFYTWIMLTRPPGSAAVLSNATAAMSTFTVDRAGQYLFSLIVSNNFGTDTAYVTVSTSNSPPVANAGPGQSLPLGATATLNGSLSSDVDGNLLTYAWLFTSRPIGSSAVLANPTSVNPTFMLDRAGAYVIQLISSDGTLSSAPATVTISTINTQPVANAGPTQAVNVGSLVPLNGGNSTDADGNPLTYAWTLNSVPAQSTATLSNTTIVNPTFTADRPGTYVAQLIVNDGFVNSNASTVTITTNAVPAPTANAGPAQTVRWGATVQLDGSAIDPGGRPITYSWSFTNRPVGSTAVFSNPNLANPTFVADVPGNFIAQLIASNPFSSSAPVTVTITTTNSTPVANAGPAQNVLAGTLVTLTGAASTDADSDPLTYAWSFTSRPNGSVASLSAPTSPSPTFTADVAGTYIVQLIVRDQFAASLPVTVTITAVAPGQIVIAATSVAPGATVALQVTLSSPAFSASTVNLAIVGAGVSLSSGTLSFAQGATTPTTPVNVTGLLLGSTQINGTGTGLTAGSGTVSVNATLAYTTSSVTIIGTATQNLALSLSVPAPTGGAVVNLLSSNTGFATVPATVTFAAGTQTVNVPVTGVAAGTATIAASGTGLNSVNGSATVVGLLAISTAALPNGTQGVAYSQQLATTGGSATAKTWLLTGGTLPTNLTLSPGGLLSGTPTELVTNRSLTFQATDPGSPTQNASATLTLSIVAVPPTAMSATSGTPQSTAISTAFSAPLVVTVTGAGGAPAAGVTVTFTAPVSGAGGTFAGGANTATTLANGVATSAVFTANSTAGGPYNVVASVSGVPSVNFALTNTAGAPASITATSGTPQSVPINTAFVGTLQATVRDSGSNPIQGVTVTFTAPGSGASGTFVGGVNTATTNASGVAISAVFTSNATVGPYNVVASVPSFSANFALTNTAGPAATVSISSGSPQTTGVTAAFGNPLVALVADAGGNPVSGVTVTFSVPGSGASSTIAGGNTAVTLANGLATSGIVTANATAGSYNIGVSAPGTQTAGFAMTNTAGAASVIQVTSGSPQTIGVTVAFGAPLVATVRDANNNPVSGATVTFAVPGSLASASITGGDTAVTGVNGQATSGVVTANATAGAYNIGASAPGTNTVNFAMTNTAGAATTIALVSGSGQSATVNSLFTNPLVATVTDAGGNPVSGVTVTFGLPVSGARAIITGANTAVTGVNGQATSGALTANATSGAYNVSASAPGTNTVNFALTNNAGAAASIARTGGNAQAATVGAQFGTVLTATVSDAGGNPVAGVTVTFAAPVSGASATIAGSNTAVTGANGQAVSGVLTANTTAGGYNVAASAPSAGSVNFGLTNNAGAAASLTATTGGGQSTTVSTPFASPLTVTVRDANSNLVSGVSVTFTVPGSGASGTFSGGAGSFNGSSNASGQVSTSIFSANATAGGPYNVVATAGALTANFALTNNAAALPNTLLLSNATVGKDLQASLTLTLTSAAPPGGLTVNFTSSNGSNVLVAGRPGDTGGVSLNGIVISEGTTSVSGIFAHGLQNSGSANITVSASGWTSGVGIITLAPSGVIMTAPGGGNSFSVPAGVNNTPVTLTSGRLNGSGVFVEAQQARGGTTIPVSLSSANTFAGTLPPTATISSANLSAGASSVNANFNALAIGSTVLTAATPTGFTAVSAGTNQVTATVTAQGLIADPVTVGRNLEAIYLLRVNSPPAADTQVTITTTDPNLRFSQTAAGAGVATLNLTIQSGRTVTQDFFVYGLASTGTASFTATAAGYSSATGTVTFGSSGFVVAGTAGFGGNFNMTSAAANQPLDVRPALLDGSGVPVAFQAVQGGVTASVAVTSSNPSVGAIITSPLSFTGGIGQRFTDFDSSSGGTTTVSVTTATAGFVTPSVQASLVVTVSAPNVGVNFSSTTVGRNLQTSGTILLGASLPTITTVTITSNNPSALLVAPNGTTAGSTSITVNIPANTLNAGFFIQGLTDNGTATVTLSAPGFTAATRTITLVPSGLVITGTNTGEIQPNSMTTSFHGRSITLSAFYLDPNTLQRIDPQAVRPGVTLTPTINSSNGGLGVTFLVITIQGGTSFVDAVFTNSAQGTTNLTINQPSGFVTPASIYTTLQVIINN